MVGQPSVVPDLPKTPVLGFRKGNSGCEFVGVVAIWGPENLQEGSRLLKYDIEFIDRLVLLLCRYRFPWD